MAGRTQDLKSSQWNSTRGPHGATVVFVVLMLGLATIAAVSSLAKSESGSGDLPVSRSIDSPTQAPNDASESIPVDWSDAPLVSARSVFAFDAESGGVLFSSNPDEERDIGSTVKIMTALVVVDHAELTDEIVIEQGDLVDNAVYSNMALVAGDTLTVEQLLNGLLIPSGSDGARALARHVGGQIDPESNDPMAVFTDAMNSRASDLGMSHSHFSNPDGDDANDAFSSATDIGVAGAELLKHPVLAGIVSQTDFTFTSVGPEAREYGGVTTNQLLAEGYDGVTGIKTGSTGQAGGCVVLAQTHPLTNQTIVIVVLGSDLVYDNGWIASDSRWDDARALLEWLDSRES